MIITIDIGNTSTAVGLFNSTELVKQFRMPSDEEKTVRDYEDMLYSNLGSVDIDGAIIGSVVENLNDRLCYAVMDLYGVKAVILSNQSRTGIRLTLKNNSEIGADRIANGYRAFQLYKKSVITVDFGTATTFDIVNSKGEFIGGVIAPGIQTQFNSLNRATAKLPELDIDYIDYAIGDCTQNAILSGVVRGSACMIDGMIDMCEQELGEKAVIIATGGFCNIVSKYMKRSFDLISPNLTLEGLHELYLLNAQPPVWRRK
ncbi:MAG: type III pantothenate kinase [Candidatus Gastranaerophilales bacterium]|nr:type III pantothenate kinase [Candidatus Gastranaerophilales bacterium]